ncbi:MAG: glutathione S-transferase family protein [Blastomonas sp.]
MTITLHHLEYSRSSRIIWLLEELGTPYEMVRHQRDPKSFRSPDALYAVHPLGKAPAIVVDGHVMGESGAIIEYLIERFGDGRLAPASLADRPAYLEWLHFAEGTLAMPIILNALSPMFGGLGGGLEPFIGGEVIKLLDHCEKSLADRAFLVGDDLSGADINLAYLIEVADANGLLDSRPALAAYIARLRDRPAYRKSLELGGPIVLGATRS